MDKQPATNAKPMTAAELCNNDRCEVHPKGRVYRFGDYATYPSFLSVGETSFRHTFVGDGPKGETVGFGLTGKDKKNSADKIASDNLYHGNLKPASEYYGELRSEGHIDRYREMERVRITGQAPLWFTEIGGGPQGETVV